MVFTCLPGPREVETVALGKDSIIEGIRAGGVYIDLTTNSPKLVRRLYDRFKEKGAHIMDVPVNDGPHDAMSGKLMLMAGGDEEVFQSCKPVLDVIGDKVRHITLLIFNQGIVYITELFLVGTVDTIQRKIHHFLLRFTQEGSPDLYNI
jgi:6-phosphogluconate dehydrogenase (decarboxylating)